ncbi:MAG: DJ-1/PfpI family protein [Floccifex sp.]
MRAAIVLDNGFEELEAMGPIALLRRAGIIVDIVGIPGKEVTGRFQVTYSPSIPFESYDFSQADCLVLPGGPHYQKLDKNEKVLELIKEFAQHKVLAAICASPTILGHAGVLQGKKYTCFKELDEDFGGFYQYQFVVTDDNIITAISAAASIDFAYAIIEKLLGKEKCESMQASIYYDAK